LFSNKESDTGNTQAGAVCCNSNKALLLNVWTGQWTVIDSNQLFILNCNRDV
jgi:hypothetical protein